MLLIVQIGSHNDLKYESNLDCRSVRRRNYRSVDHLNYSYQLTLLFLAVPEVLDYGT